MCTWLGLHADTGEERLLELALDLVDAVHDTLGRHRPDDPRGGRLSGLDDPDAALHPTAGGLRIGKPLPESAAGVSRGPDDEWERDGQYFHYLTRWMHALHRVSEHTGDMRYHRWARELAVAAHDAFVMDTGGGRPLRMVWKMNVDLSRPTVGSMGQLDPLDGLITYAALQAGPGAGSRTARAAPDATGGAGGADDLPDLVSRIRSFERICEDRSQGTEDPLGAGGLLVDTWRWGRLVAAGVVEHVTWPERRLKDVSREARVSLDAVAGALDLKVPWRSRLAFRELGLSLGLHAAERLAALCRDDPVLSRDEVLKARVEAMAAWAPLAASVERSWLAPDSREAASWTEHEDVNEVALATSLAPGGYLGE